MRAENELGFDFSGVPVQLEGLESGLARRLAEAWRVYRSEPSTAPFLRLRVSEIDRPYNEEEYRPKRMASELSADRAHFSMPEGDAEVVPTGTARVRLVRGIGERGYYSLINLLRACLAWRLPSRGGCLLHSSGIVLDGRGFLLVGPEGSGKSTWVRLAAEAGATALSDDLNLVDGSGSGIELLGGPFRSTYKAELLQGRWPLTAILFPVHGERPSWRPATTLAAQVRLAANLPFIADAIEQDPRISELLQRFASAVPCSELTFAKEAGFVDLLRRWPEQ